jgi:DNA-binding transcriptional ArsR family regulator
LCGERACAPHIATSLATPSVSRLHAAAIVNRKVNNAAKLDKSFDALAHPVRRAIVERLARGPATVGEATRGVTVSKPAVSKHLKVLEEAGLIRREIDGRQHRLSLEARGLNAATRWLELHRTLWEAKFDAVERHLANEDKRRS